MTRTSESKAPHSFVVVYPIAEVDDVSRHAPSYVTVCFSVGLDCRNVVVVWSPHVNISVWSVVPDGLGSFTSLGRELPSNVEYEKLAVPAETFATFATSISFTNGVMN